MMYQMHSSSSDCSKKYSCSMLNLSFEGIVWESRVVAETHTVLYASRLSYFAFCRVGKAHIDKYRNMNRGHKIV